MPPPPPRSRGPPRPGFSHCALSQGGLGLTCASVLATPAFWSSWADSLPVIHNQLPQYAGQILEQLQHPSATVPSIQAVAGAGRALEERGWTPPSWAELTQGIQPNAPEETTEEAPRTRGWQQRATIPVHTAMYNELQAAIPPASQAMLQSQAGPFASRAFTTRVPFPPLQDPPPPSSPFAPPTPPQLGRRSSSPRPPPCPRHPCRASQSPPSPVVTVEGLDLYLPYLKHIWRLASIKTVCAWKLPSKTALYQWTFMRPKRCGGKKIVFFFDIFA